MLEFKFSDVTLSFLLHVLLQYKKTNFFFKKTIKFYYKFVDTEHFNFYILLFTFCQKDIKRFGFSSTVINEDVGGC